MAITAKLLKELRDRTAAGMMECKRALTEAEGDIEAAIDLLRTRGAAKAAKRSDRSANEGTIGSYVHQGGRIAVIVELNCETDFVAKNEEFLQLARDLAMHIAAARPLAVSESDIPQDEVEREKAIYLEQVKAEGKPEAIWDKIVTGKLQKFFKENTLLGQPFIKDSDQTVGELVTEASARTGEKIEVARFARLEVGG
jgi:elongation factor Ts